MLQTVPPYVDTPQDSYTRTLDPAVTRASSLMSVSQCRVDWFALAFSQMRLPPLTTSPPPYNNPPQKSSLAAALMPDVARRRFVLNVASNVAYMMASTVLMIWYVPFLIGHLGVSAYGIVPLAHSIVSYISIVTEGLNVATTRFLTIDLNRLDENAANKTFNTAFFVSVVIVCALLPIAMTVTWWFPTLFQVPMVLETQSRLLFGGVALTFVLGFLGGNFEVSTLILHRFELRNLLRGLTMATRVGLVVICFKLLPAQLWHVGAGLVASALVTFSGAWLLWHHLTPDLCIRWSAFDWSCLRQLFSFSIWSIVNRIGALLFLSTGILIVNRFLGAEQTGQYGTLLLFPSMFQTLVDTAASVLSPAIMARYAVRDTEGMRRLATQAVKLIAISLALPIGLLSGLAQPWLNIWLGPEFQSFDILLIILVGHYSINLSTRPLSYVLTSYNKIRVQGIVTLALGVLNVILSIGLVRWGGLGMVGVAVATALVTTIRNLIFLSAYSAHLMELHWWTFYPILMLGAFSTLTVGLSAYGLAQLWRPVSWLALGGIAMAVSLGYVITAWFVSLRREDRQLFLALIPR